MSDDQLESKQLSRRDLLRRAGLGGIGIIAVGTLGTGALSAASASADDSPEGFLVSAFNQRAQAMSTGSTQLLDSLYDPASTQLLAFEKERASFFHTGLGARWNATILDYSASVYLVDISLAGSSVSARIYESTSFGWIPHPIPQVPLPPEAIQIRQENPDRLQVVPTGPRGEIASAMGTRHDILLIKGSTGWRIAKDAYQEIGLFGASPDISSSPWANSQGPGPSSGATPGTGSPATAAGSNVISGGSVT